MWAVLIAIAAFFTGVGCTVGVLMLWERRIMAKHGGKMGLALSLLDEVAQGGAK